LVGYGENYTKIKEKIDEKSLQNQIVFLASIEDINLHEIGLFISTSLYEGMPNVVLEALNMGIRCIQYDFDGNDFNTDLVTSIKQKNIEGFIHEIKSKLTDNINFSGEDFKFF